MQQTDFAQLKLADYTQIFDLKASGYNSACIDVANDVGIFNSLQAEALSASNIAKQLDLAEGVVTAICLVLAANELLITQGDQYTLSEIARTYLCSASPLYSGPINHMAKESFYFKKIYDAAKQGWAPIEDAGVSYTEMWQQGDLSPKAAQKFTDLMHSLIMGPAIAAARSGAFADVKHLVDAGGSSGAFCMALKSHQPDIRVTLMDLPQVCEAAEKHLTAHGFNDKNKVDIYPCNFFTDEWPTNADAYHFGNILHDWSIDTGLILLKKAYDVLPKGGHIFIHEALLTEDKLSPKTIVLFNLLMFLNHRSQQYTKNEIFDLLQQAGFVKPEVVSYFAYYSVIKAVKE